MAIMAECAGLSEMTPSEADLIKAIVEWLVHKPTTDYLPTTHLTEHHIDLTDYTPIRRHSRCRSPVIWATAQEAVRDITKLASSRDQRVDGVMPRLFRRNQTANNGFA